MLPPIACYRESEPKAETAEGIFRRPRTANVYVEYSRESLCCNANSGVAHTQLDTTVEQDRAAHLDDVGIEPDPTSAPSKTASRCGLQFRRHEVLLQVIGKVRDFSVAPCGLQLDGADHGRQEALRPYQGASGSIFVSRARAVQPETLARADVAPP